MHTLYTAMNNFVHLIFIHNRAYENILTTKISRTTVEILALCYLVLRHNSDHNYIMYTVCVPCSRCKLHSKGPGQADRPSLLPHHLYRPCHVLLLPGGDAAV